MADTSSSAEHSPEASKINALAPKPNYVYLIATCDQGAARSYVGWTTDLEKRLTAHNAGTGAKSTRGRQWRLVHSEVFNTRGEAMAREYELKKDRKTRRALMLGAGLDGMPD